MNRDAIESLLRGYAPLNEPELSYREEMLSLLELDDRSWTRSHYTPGHFTASTFVADMESREVALIYHGKLHRWLQPGGHVEPEDPDPVASAKRELREETGWEATAELLLFDLDIHVIPARPGQPGHRHFDLRFIVRLEQNSLRPVLKAGDDAESVMWHPLNALLTNEEPGMKRAASKILSMGD